MLAALGVATGSFPRTAESADFTLALWATLTPVAGGCTFSVNGVLRVRCSVPSAAPICSYVFRRGARP